MSTTLLVWDIITLILHTGWTPWSTSSGPALRTAGSCNSAPILILFLKLVLLLFHHHLNHIIWRFYTKYLSWRLWWPDRATFCQSQSSGSGVMPEPTYQVEVSWRQFVVSHPWINTWQIAWTVQSLAIWYLKAAGCHLAVFIATFTIFLNCSNQLHASTHLL